MMTRRARWTALIGPLAAVLLVTGCGSAGGTSPDRAPARSSSPAEESSPLGDIPDNQVFVPYRPADGSFSVTVPEGWARTDLAGGASFTDKLNTVAVQQLSGRPQPTVDSVGSSELADSAAAGGHVTVGDVETRTLPAGEVVHATYSADSAPDPVTGRTVRDDVELYVFWRDGAEVLLTLSGPHGADDVDAWNQVSRSFAWK
jgi:hypothetical protein